jgi:hypothetical protein
MIVSETFVQILYTELSAVNADKDDMTESVAESGADHTGWVAA